MTTALCIVAAVLVLAVYALGVSLWLQATMAMCLAFDRELTPRMVRRCWLWPLAMIGVVK